MSNKLKILILLIVVVIVVIGIVSIISRNKEEGNSTNGETSVEYNEETGEYYILDKQGNILTKTTDESYVKILQDDPTYDPKFPSSNT
jgi:competence protein ComGC